MAVRLSKSRLMASLQCERRLWLEVHRPELAAVSGATRAAFGAGNEVGDLARSLYSAAHEPGHLLEYDAGLSKALESTRRLLADPGDHSPIFEATFQHDGLLVRLDVLLRNGEGARIIEVKASTRVKREHLTDCAIQAWVSRGAGLQFGRVSLAHIDSRFIYRGDGDYRGLLREQDISTEVAALLPEVPGWLAAARAAAGRDGEPEVVPGKRCVTPWECGFMGHCWPAEAAYPVQALGGDRDLLGSFVVAGFRDLRDIPPERLSRADHRRIQAVTRSGVAQVDPELGAFIRSLAFPCYFLDFETAAPAVPVFAGTRPYEALPFQFSCHVLQADGTIGHREHLDLTGADPRRGCAEALLTALDGSGPVLVYTGYEQRVIKDLARRFPDLADPLRALNARLVDLHPVLRRHYYHPDMRGSWSLKKIIPVIAPDLRYDAGEIQEGNAASAAWLEVRQPGTTAARREALAAELKRYCALDTEGLMRVCQHFLLV